MKNVPVDVETDGLVCKIIMEKNQLFYRILEKC